MNSRYALFFDDQCVMSVPFMAKAAGEAGRPFTDHSLMIEWIIYRYRAG